ncbi:ABC transporter substrate-binding protein [Elusimicrobiota bacterium]
MYKRSIYLSCLFLAAVFSGIYADIGNKLPERIISLGPTLTENIFLLGAGDKLIANTSYCNRPAEADSKEKIGTLIKANLEKIVELKPDLVLATSLTNMEQIQIMRNMGLEVVVFRQPENFQVLCSQFIRLGDILGMKKKAEKIINSIETKIEDLKKSIAHLSGPSVFIQIGAHPLFTANKDSFVNDFIEFAGGINIASEAKTGMYSREKVLQADPEIIIIVTMGITGEEEKKTWQEFTAMNAVKNDKIYIIDSYEICSPSPVGFLNTLEKMIIIFYGLQE